MNNLYSSLGNRSSRWNNRDRLSGFNHFVFFATSFMRLPSPTLKEIKIYLFKKIFRRQKKKKELFREFLRGRGRKVFVAFCRRPKCDKYEEAESCFRITTSERPSEPACRQAGEAVSRSPS
jgi:ssDNA-binding Zn-finger/Zn-ribbon topoisomerase 1